MSIFVLSQDPLILIQFPGGGGNLKPKNIKKNSKKQVWFFLNINLIKGLVYDTFLLQSTDP
jgi:hypothetical protein